MNLCKRMQKPNLFKFVDREFYQSQKQPRWDQKFYQDIIQEAMKPETQKVWMCGPPVMQEELDKEWIEQQKQTNSFKDSDKLVLL